MTKRTPKKRSYRVVGDVLRAFTVEIDHADFEALSEDDQKDIVADALELRRFGRDEDVRIDSIELA